MKTKLSWKPVRHGDTYCSPACGGGCTYAEFEKATKKAAALAKRLGPNWKPKVWENLGWHYSIVDKENSIEVCPSTKDNLYFCLPNPSYTFWCDEKHYCDPKRAVKATVRLVRKVANEHLAVASKMTPLLDTL